MQRVSSADVRDYWQSNTASHQRRVADHMGNALRQCTHSKSFNEKLQREELYCHRRHCCTAVRRASCLGCSLASS